ncbi:MAG: hypothetical protein RRB13_02630 [bacterium]|nr:hypothetical protein [bacterium]
MLNATLLGRQIGHAAILADPFAGQPSFSVALFGAQQAHGADQLPGFVQIHNLRGNLSDGVLYDVESALHQQFAQNVFFSGVLRYGFLYITVTHSGSQVQRFSHEAIEGVEHFWDQQISSLPAIQYETREFGGYIKLTWGKIGFLPGAFKDEAGSAIAPPDKLHITAQWGARDDRSRTIFEGDAVLRRRGAQGAEYDLFEPDYKALVLSNGVGFNSVLAVTSLSADGTKLLVTTEADHGRAVGERVLLQRVAEGDSAAFEGEYPVSAVPAPNQFEVLSSETGTAGNLECSAELVPLPLVLGQVPQVPLVRTGKSTGWKFYRPSFVGTLGAGLTVHDDGVDVTDGTWAPDGTSNKYLDRGATQVFGTASAQGTGQQTSLGDLFSWGCARLGLDLDNLELGGAYDPANIEVGALIDSQMAVIDLLDQVAGACNYSFWIDSLGLHLFSNRVAHGDAGTLDDFELFEVDYAFELPVRHFKCSWQERFAGSQNNGAGSSIPALKTAKKEVVVQGTSALGEEKNLVAFSYSEATNRARLEALAAERELAKITLKSPLERLPVFGEAIALTDTQLEPAANVSGKVRSFLLDFGAETLTIFAKGTLT